MEKQRIYESPAVREQIALLMEESILTGSVVDVSGVKTSGQSIGDLFNDASSTGDSSFNQSWGE